MKKLFKENKKIVLLVGMLCIFVFLLLFFKDTFSEKTTSSIWDGTVASSFSGGNGTSDRPYIINNGSELAYFFKLINGSNSSEYFNKYYELNNNINLNGKEFSFADINKQFSGSLNGAGYTISNFKISKHYTDVEETTFSFSLFSSLYNANIKNINFKDITFIANDKMVLKKKEEPIKEKVSELEESTKEEVSVLEEVSTKEEETSEVVINIDASLFRNVENSNINNININDVRIEYSGDKELLSSSLFILNDNGSNNIENINITGSSNIESTNILVDKFNGSTLKNIMFESSNLSLVDEFDYTSKYDIYEYSIEKGEIAFNNKRNLEYVVKSFNENSNLVWKYENGEFRIINNGVDPSKQITNKPTKRSTIVEHASGVANNTVYVNDLASDLNYFTGLNYTEVRSTSIPSGVSTHYYDPEYLVKVELIYDGKDLNNSSLVGSVSPINNETSNKYVYFKYYALERNSNGTLATDSNNNNYIKIELIDNPFSKRPYVNQTEYGFNGWTCNQSDDTTDDVCSVSKFSINTDDYTRYLEVPISGGSEVVIHLNATWYETTPVTSYGSIGNLSNMTMVTTGYTVPETIVHTASYFWKQNYTQMEYVRSYTRGDDQDGYMPAGSYYRNNRDSGMYSYTSNRRRCGWNQTCYVFTPNTSAIVAGTKYNGGTVTFVSSFRANNSNTETTINSYNTNYMELLDDPDGQYTFNETVQRQKSYIPTGYDTQGFYYQVSNPTSAMLQTRMYYTSSGTLCTSTSSCSTAYKLIHYDDEMLKDNGESISIIEEDSNNEVINGDKYYYLVTRDMNIVRITGTVSYSNLNTNRPYTLTGTAVNGTSASGTINISTSRWTVPGDIRIENIRINGPDYNLNTNSNKNRALGYDVTNYTSYGTIYANSHNFKIGRNVTPSDGTAYLSVGGIYGGTYDASPSGLFRVIVESGNYLAYHSGRMSSSTTNYTFNETTIFGSDYDRVTNTNKKLYFEIGLDGYAGGRNNADSYSSFASWNIIKSGTFGYNYDDTPNNDDTAGLYIGARASTYANSITGAKIEGGNINTVVGGYGYNGSETTNSTFIGMSGGTVRSIYGGAGHSTTKGNRIVCVTGGTVTYSVLGGSNSFESGYTDDGILQGNTLVYVGGNVTVGGGSGKLYGVESGTVFGAGGGDTSSTEKGTVYNSHVIINGGTINSSVYGGGNYGSTGTVNTNASTTKIEVFAGNIGNVFGGSRSADFGVSNQQTSSIIDIDITGGTIGNVYGGSNRHGTIYGNIDINITGGSITGNVYGGGKGGAEEATTEDPATLGTFTTNGVSVTIGDSSTGPTISGSVYGGSAFGSVSDSAQGNVTVTINKGTISTDVYGGGQGDANHDSIVNADVTVEMKGGTVQGDIYGGPNVAGFVYGDTTVQIKGGSCHDVYGGGKGSSTFVSDNVEVTIGTQAAGPTVNGSVYGGSAYGTVNAITANAAANSSKHTYVTIENGNILGAAFGGAKGDSNNTPYVKGNIKVEVNGGSTAYVYGGFDAAGTPQGSVLVNLNGGTVGEAYGGGNNTSIATTNIYLKGAQATSVFGGSRQSGTATTTNVYIQSGSATEVYGGNNAGGQATTSIVRMTGGSVPTVYGGNKSGGTNPNSQVYYSAGTVTDIFGGGYNASTGTTYVEINGGHPTNVYGGGDQASVTTSQVVLNQGTIDYTYGGGRQAGATTTTVSIPITSTATATTVYGGSNTSGNVTTSNVNALGGVSTTIYGGNNAGGVTSTANVTIDGISVTNVYGGGRAAAVNYGNVRVDSGTITGSVHGGGKDAPVNSNTSVKIFGGTISGNVYGGGENGTTSGNTNVIINNGTINGSAYGGGDGSTAVVSGSSNITVGGTTTIGTNQCTVLSQCSVFGGGRAAATGTTTTSSSSNVKIVGGTIHGNVYGGANTSVVYGGTSVDIGADVTTTSEFTRSNILINGTVFGGGEANASGSPNYDWHYVGVTESILVNINALNYNNFDILGSIFGSGNASTTTGTSNINIKNYGTYGNPKRNISIQRTDLLVIDNSALVLEGATDRTNEYSDVLFTLSIIQELQLKNNSTLYLETGANELRSYKSLTATGDPVTIDIDDENKTLTRDADNRIYMYGAGNKVLNIANETLTTYGNVTGMTFFGLFKYGTNRSIVVGIYDDYDYGETVNLDGGLFTSGSYVLGAHKTNHDITADGFYSNFVDGQGVNTIKIIDPTPEDAPMYMWVIGEYVQTYEVNLMASKYSTLGAVELPLIDYTVPNTTFEIRSVDFSGLENGVQLVNKNSIPKISSNLSTVDTTMGLSLETSNSGWLTSGSTSFYTNTTPHIQGLKYYVGENSTNVPSLLFYLYHSKNLQTSGSLGTVQIEVRVTSRIDDLTSEPETLIINVNISRVLYTTNDYEASLTAGRKYELFTSTTTKITSKSSISAYFSLYAENQNVYQTGYHRALVSNIALPENTKITMIDLSMDTAKYYYHVITAADVTAAQAQIQFDGEADYNLSMFEVMGAFNSGVHYDDATMNALYYRQSGDYSQEEFIFIIDFEDTNFANNSLDNYILFELQNSNNQTIVSVLGIQESGMHYDVYKGLDAVIDINGTISSNTIYSGETVTLDLLTNYTQSQVSNNTIYDTKLFDEKVGLKISIINSQGKVVSGTSLIGLTYEIAGASYSPSIDGTARIKIADRVGSIETWIKVKTGTSKFATGNYTLRVESFGSPDGIYYGLNTSDYIDFPIYIVNEIYGLDVTAANAEMIIDKITGYTLNGNNQVTYDIEYNSGLTHPSIRIKLLRREYTGIYSTDYNGVDLTDYVSNTLTATANTNEYLVVNNPSRHTYLTLNMKNNLTPGTYMVEFMLYDNSSLIGTVEKYIIIR